MPQTITRLNPPGMPDSASIGYSQISIVEPGRMAWVSGQVASPGDGQPAPPDLTDQLQLVFGNARKALEALGAGPQDIVIARCFMTDMTPERLALVFPPLLAFFDGAMPCVTGVGVAALAVPDLQVEVELTVRLPG